MPLARAAEIVLYSVCDPDTPDRPLLGRGYAAYSGVFIVPSLLWAIGGPGVEARIIAAHDQAVAASIGYLERHAAFVRRGRDGQERMALVFSRVGNPSPRPDLAVSMTRPLSRHQNPRATYSGCLYRQMSMLSTMLWAW